MIDKCPKCGGPLETFLRIDLNNVVLEKLAHTPDWSEGTVTRFSLAMSANDPSTGIVVEEARVTCADCGNELAADIPSDIAKHWTYSA